MLLLDEPTNDLDVDTLRALEEALLDFAGCAVVITHDRWFLDRVATHILAFEGDSQTTWFEGAYGEYADWVTRDARRRGARAAPDQVQAARAAGLVVTAPGVRARRVLLRSAPALGRPVGALEGPSHHRRLVAVCVAVLLGREALPRAVRLQHPGVDVLRERAVEDGVELLAHPARSSTGTSTSMRRSRFRGIRSALPKYVADSSPRLEAVDAAVLQEPPEDRAHADVLAHALDARAAACRSRGRRSDLGARL